MQISKPRRITIDNYPWGIVTAGTYGEPEVGLATKNRGENSTEDASETGLAGMKERGDSPEQLKDTQGMGHSPDQSRQTDDQGGGDLSSSAMKAFHQNLELIQEYADSPISGKDHPLLSALDQMLEEAFPGYRDGHEGHGEATDVPGAGAEPHGDREEEEEPEKRLAALGDDNEHWLSDETLGDRSDLGYPADWEALCKYADSLGKKLGQSWDPMVYGNADDVSLEDAIQYMQSEPGMATGGFPEMSDEAWESLASFFIETLRDTVNLDSGQTELTLPEGWTAGVKESIPGSVGQGFNDPMGVGAGGMLVPPDQATTEPACPTCGVAHAPGTPCAGTAMPGQDNPAMAGVAGNMMYRQPLTPPRPQSVVTHQGASVDLADEQEMIPRRQDEEHHDNRHEDGLEGANEGWYEKWDGPEKDTEPWVDDAGSSLVEGQQYELHSSKYAIPDRITVESVTPHKLTFKIHSGDVDYRDELTPDDIANYGYSFQAPKDGMTDSESGFPLEDKNPQPEPAKRSPLNLTQPPPRQGAAWGDHEIEPPVQPIRGEYDTSPGDVIAAYPDGTIVLDDGITTYNPERAQAFIDAGGTYQQEAPAAPEAPVRPGADALPQVDDLSVSPTKQGSVEEMQYTGSFRGDDTNSRSWLMSGGSAVEVDPEMMMKVAGRDFSPQEQRELINEEGVGGPARNIETRMDLAGTHYEFQDDPYADSLW